MKQLGKHIDLLLQENDCVILPGFGGFLAHSVSAYYVKEEHLFFPPSRTLSFNAQLTMNDGLLAQSYMQTYHLSYAEACHRVEKAVEQIQDSLEKEGTIDLPGLGKFQQDIHHTLQFMPEEAGISTPDYFGLNAFDIECIAELSRKNTQTTKPMAVSLPEAEKTIDFHVSKQFLHQVASVAAAILIMVLFVLPLNDGKTSDAASLLSISGRTNSTNAEVASDLSIETEPAEISTIDSTFSNNYSILSKADTLTVSTEDHSLTKAEEQPVTTISTDNRKCYHIIVASLPNRRGAEQTLKEFVEKGYKEATLLPGDNRTRISLAEFTDKEEANGYLETIRQNKLFENAWLLAVRN